MDKNTITGLVLICAIMIGFGYFSSPSKEEREAEQHRIDSLRTVQANKNLQEELARKEAEQKRNVQIDSSAIIAQMGSFANAMKGESRLVSIENNLMRIKISNKGGRVYSAEIKNYTTYGGSPLVLFEGDQNTFGLQFWGNNNNIETNNLYFVPSTTDSTIIATDASQSLTMRLLTSETSYIDYIYTIEPDSYLLNFDIKFVGMENTIKANSGAIDLNWKVEIPQLEKGLKNEKQYTQIAYMFSNDDYEELMARGDGTVSEQISTKLKWVDFKQQYFSSILVAKDCFLDTDIKMADNTKVGFIRTFDARMGIPYENKSDETVNLNFYFGPNHFKTMEDYGMGFEKVIPLGRNIVRWVNKYVVINVFNWLNGSIASYGLIILILTILVKLVLFPITYKSYISSAKMRVLKPQIDEINARYPKQDDAMKKQQATMALYKKVGVNPMSGCLPMIIQFPILIAMFRFFPASVELRQQSFLWADDLSSFDSILDLPFNIPWYGDHISLFALLMAITFFLQTKMNTDQMGNANAQMPGMKFMMTWMMPIMMLFMFNSFSAGLNYYYFLSSLITIGQTILIRQFIDDNKVLAKLQENSKKPAPAKSKWQQKLEDMQKKQQQMQRQQMNKKK